MQAFNDTDPNHKQIFKEEICFKFVANLGTHMRYVWQSQTYPDFRGVATQEGDHVMLHGDYTQQGNAVYHDAMIFELVTQSPRDLGAGHWTLWQEDGAYGKTSYSANVTMERQPQSTCSVKVAGGGAGLSPEDLFRQQ